MQSENLRKVGTENTTELAYVSSKF